MRGRARLVSSAWANRVQPANSKGGNWWRSPLCGAHTDRHFRESPGLAAHFCPALPKTVSTSVRRRRSDRQLNGHSGHGPSRRGLGQRSTRNSHTLWPGRAVKPQTEPRRGALWAGERMPATESANAPSRSRLCLAVWCTPGFLRLARIWADRLTFMSHTPLAPLQGMPSGNSSIMNM